MCVDGPYTIFLCSKIIISNRCNYPNKWHVHHTNMITDLNDSLKEN